MQGPDRKAIAEATDPQAAYNRPYGLAVLRGMQGKNIYQGTVPHAEKVKRRLRAKAARKANRSRRGRR